MTSETYQKIVLQKGVYFKLLNGQVSIVFSDRDELINFELQDEDLWNLIVQGTDSRELRLLIEKKYTDIQSSWQETCDFLNELEHNGIIKQISQE